MRHANHAVVWRQEFTKTYRSDPTVQGTEKLLEVRSRFPSYALLRPLAKFEENEGSLRLNHCTFSLAATDPGDGSAFD